MPQIRRSTRPCVRYKLCVLYLLYCISCCRLSSQSPGVSFFTLGVVEKSRFAVEIAVISIYHTVEYISNFGFDGHIAISDYP